MSADIFEVLIQKADLEKLDCRPLETSFGKTTEFHVFMNGDDMGILEPEKLYPYHDRLKRFNHYEHILNLKSLIGTSQAIDKLQNLIDQLSLALIIFESDCDQHEIKLYSSPEYALNDLFDERCNLKSENMKAFTLEINKNCPQHSI